MNEQQVNKIIEDSYDASKEEGLRTFVSDFYGRTLLSSAIAAWVIGLLCVALSIFSAVQFFNTGETQQHIMYGVLFLVGVQGLVLMKIFSWQMIHRHGLKRDIKRLELRLVELSATLKTR